MEFTHKVKLKAGRQRCLSRLLGVNAGAEFPLDQLPLPKARDQQQRQQSGDKDELPPKLVSMLCVEGSGGYPSRSDLLFAFLCEALRKKMKPEAVADACVDEKYRGFGIFEHCHDNDGREYVLRQIERALSKVDSTWSTRLARTGPTGASAPRAAASG